MSQVYVEDVSPGYELPPLEKPAITLRQLVMYAGASGDFNPIHYDYEFAKKVGLPSIIAHGVLSCGFMAQHITRWAGQGTLQKWSVRFVAMVLPGDVITCTGTVTAVQGDRVELDVEAKNQKGEAVISGKATVALPRRK